MKVKFHTKHQKTVKNFDTRRYGRDLEIKTGYEGVTPSGSFGYEVFDKNTFGQTSFVQRVNRQRALEGELVRTIKYINGVKRARVHLSLPESSPFVIEKKPPSASVVIELEDGVSLTAEEIKGLDTLFLLLLIR